jgi:signal transduction histidine kinase
VRLAQVFSNLLNNAAKYTEAGGRVTLSVRRGMRLAAPKSGGGAAAGAGGTCEAVAVCVKDTGIGIPTTLLTQLFELFAQAHRHLNRSQGGLGVGLALVRRLAEMHGGTVGAASDGPGTGAEFVVTLPVAS